MEDSLKVLENGREPQSFENGNALNILQIEDDPPPHPRDDAFPNLTEGWLSSSQIFSVFLSLS